MLLAKRVPLVVAGIISRPRFSGFHSGDQFMFDGKNNRILDSFSFRFVMTAGVFVAWFVAGYMLIAAA